MSTPVQVKRWGSSMAILIPRSFARLRQIEVGTMIDLESVQVVQRPRRRYKLSELVTQYRPEHRHGEWELGGPIGNETW